MEKRSKLRMGPPEAGKHSLSKMKVWYDPSNQPPNPEWFWYSQDWSNQYARSIREEKGIDLLMNRCFVALESRYAVTHATIFDSEKMGKPKYHWNVHINRWVTDAEWQKIRQQFKREKSMLKAWVCYHTPIQWQRRSRKQPPNETRYSREQNGTTYRNKEIKLRKAVDSLIETVLTDLNPDHVERIFVYLVAPDQDLTTDRNHKIGRIDLKSKAFFPTAPQTKKALQFINHAKMEAVL